MKTPARRPALAASLAIALALAPAAAHADTAGDTGSETSGWMASAETADLADTGLREDVLLAVGIAAVAVSSGVLALAIGRARRISAEN